jgi:hypothetical protein
MIAVAHSPPRLVSPLQAALGAFLGGLIGFAYFSRANCVATGDRAGARTMLVRATAVFLVWHAAVALALFHAASVPLTMLFGGTPFVLLGAAHHVVEKQVASANGRAVFRSGWNVLGITVLCFMASAACALAVIVGVVVALLGASGFRT